MAKTYSDGSMVMIIRKYEDPDNPGSYLYDAECRYHVGTTDDPALLSARSKVYTLSGTDASNMAAIYSNCEAQMKSDEGIV